MDIATHGDSAESKMNINSVMLNNGLLMDQKDTKLNQALLTKASES